MSVSSEAPRKFNGTLEKAQKSGLRWTILRVPFSIEKAWGVRGVFRVRVEVNGYGFPASLLPTGKGEHYMIVSKKIQKAARISPGVSARYTIAADRSSRELRTPPELARVLKEDASLRKWFDGLSRTIKKWLIDMVANAQSTEARTRRARRIAEQLMEAMEAEIELPPMIAQHLRRTPGGEKTWDRMTPLQRRANLIAIFNYRTPQSRLRRLEKVIALKREETAQ